MKYHVDFDIELRKNIYKGLYIALEGIDASGKTTQLKNLSSYFRNQGKQVVEVKEPTREGVIGELIHKILQSEIEIPRVSLQYLIAADREVNLETVVIPALSQGKVVISDRSFWSSIPYGLADIDGDGRKNDRLTALSILSLYHQFIKPDFAFYLDVSVEEAVKRLTHFKKIKEIYEREETLQKVHANYMWLIKEFSKEMTVVDGEGSVEKVTKEIIAKLESLK